MTHFHKRLAVSAGFLLFAAVMFRVVWPQGVVIHSSDYNYGLMAMYKAELPAGMFQGFWRGFPLLGRVGSLPPTFTNLVLTALPIEPYMDWIYAILLLMASGFLIGFLRLRGAGWTASTVGALTAFWLGSNLTLILPGHLLKYGVLAFAAATLFCLENAHQTRSWRWAALAGGSLGWMFMHQADVALFFGLVLGAYHLFRCAEGGSAGLPRAGGLSLAVLFVAGLLVWESYQTQMDSQVRNVEILQSGTPEEQWSFATQWSQPPGEWLDFIAPGYWGWTTPHETAPYHGATGRDAIWESTGQGLANFKMESVYLGLVPLGLAALALFRERNVRKEIGFWLAASLITLLLAFGDGTPLYRAFFQLPLVNAIRNPNKFLQVFQVCAGILAAFGLDGLLKPTTAPRVRAIASGGFLAAALLLGIGSLLVDPEDPRVFADTLWASRATSILQHRQLALLHGSLMAGWAAGCLYPMRNDRWRAAGGAALILAVGADGLLLGRHYLKPAPVDFVQENPLADYLKANLGVQRVAVLHPDGLSQFYLTHLFPAHHIPFADIAVAPRLERDYRAYFDNRGPDKVRIWKEFGVKYVLAPRSVFDGLRARHPALGSILKEAWSYSLAQPAPGRLRLTPGTAQRPGDFLVLEFLVDSDRFLLEEGTGALEGIQTSPTGFLLSVNVTAPTAALRLADRYHPALRARIGSDDPIPLHPIDGLFAGVDLPQGVYNVELTYDPPIAGRAAQGAGLLLCLGILLSLGFRPAKPVTTGASTPP